MDKLLRIVISKRKSKNSLLIYVTEYLRRSLSLTWLLIRARNFEWLLSTISDIKNLSPKRPVVFSVLCPRLIQS